MNDALRIPDLGERARALDPRRSFIVQAPAGSGKTELLIQRVLALLATAERPEEIAAITFTIKAAAEMRRRVLEAIAAARTQPRPDAAHHAMTWDLARAVLARNDEKAWGLEETPERLRVQTIDALCASLTRQMPVLSRFGGQPESVEDASAMYVEAARGLLEQLEGGDEAAAADVAHLLEHVDNNAGTAEKLLAAMLAGRDTWVRKLLRTNLDRDAMEEGLREVRGTAVHRLQQLWPPGLPAPHLEDVGGWITHAGGFLLGDGKDWRKDAPAALKDTPGAFERVREVQQLPPATFDDGQWDMIVTIARLAPRALAQLQLVFARRGQADFIEISQGALRALGNEDEPTDLMLSLDYRLRHILVDEFQDTSHSQFELLERLTSGWEPGDGRTLFLVGDPMQSIYRFREADVGLFLRAWERGIGTVELERITLSANFRSRGGIVEWVNASFARVMPEADDLEAGAVSYSASSAVHDHDGPAVHTHPFLAGDEAGMGGQVAKIVAESAGASVAILVRSRLHLEAVVPRLREAGLAFRAIEIEPLGDRPVVQDLLALTRALSHLADRTAWLAVLRAPWCGLTLADLTALCAQDDLTVWAAINDAGRVAAISADGRTRLERARAILGEALAQRRRSSLRAAVEGAWLALGGPACVERDVELDDADIYLDHLEAAESGGALDDVADFEQSIEKLYALPDLDAPETLQVMTIHKAKGLEFDVVVVPGLEAGTARDDRRLFMWMQTPEDALLVAALNAAGAEGDPVYDYIREVDKRKADHENARLLYVAATRARRALHLLGCAKLDEHGGLKVPPRGSLLHKLWPVVCGDFAGLEAAPPKARETRVPPSSQGTLRRLDVAAFAFTAPEPVAWTAPAEVAAREEIEFSWVGDTARRIGSVVHRRLQRIAEDEARGWNRARVEKERPALRRELAARGVAESELDRAEARSVAALIAALDDERGRWLLGPQRGARNEYRLSTVAGGVHRMLVIDRMFEDAEGRTWIVDYKTSGHEGAEVERFLDEEQVRYRDQLERYALALDRRDAKRGLYFPLLKGWREW